jgi:hypothetical protein
MLSHECAIAALLLCVGPGFARENLARNAVATASSSLIGHSPGSASDGSLNSYWAPATGAGMDSWLELSWNAPVTVRELVVRRGDDAAGESPFTRLTVEVFDGQAWRVLQSSGDGTLPIPLIDYLRFPERTVSKLRLTGLGEGASIRELELYATQTPPWLDVRGDAKGNIIGVFTDGFGSKGIPARIEAAGNAAGKPWSARTMSDGDGAFTISAPLGLTGPIQFSASWDGQPVQKIVSAGDIHQGLVPRPAGSFTQSLDGAWLFRPDPPAGFEQPGATEDDWKPIETPSHWAMKGFVTESGYGGYRKHVRIPEDWRGRRIRVAFDGVYSGAEVWWNGVRAGSHLGGATPFQLDVTESARPGSDNVLAVRVAEKSMASELDHMSMYADFSLAGIFRSAYVFSIPPAHIARVQSHAGLRGGPGSADLVVDVGIVNESPEPAPAITLSLRLLDASGRVVSSGAPRSFDLAPWASAKHTARLAVNAPLLWTAEHPNVYRLEGVLSRSGVEVQRVSQNAGFRETRIEGTKVLVNGVPLKFKGTCHHDSHPLLGRAVTPELERQDLELIKEANLDALRTSHYPPLPELLDIADELGVYIEEEAPFCWVDNSSDLRYGALTRQLTAEMVERDMSHPSVAYWSAGNESRWGPILNAGEREIRLSDPSRPVIGSWAGSGHFDMTVRHNPITVAEMKELEGNDRPVIWDESLCLFQGIFGDGQEIWRDPGERDYYVAPLIDVMDSFWSSKVVQGSFVWAWSDDLFLVPGRGSEYGRNFVEAPGVERIYSREGYGLVGDAPWGVVDGWRRKKPEFWHIKKLHSPVRVAIRQLPLPSRGESLRVPLQNRYFFTNLSELRIEWRLGDHTGTVRAEVPPQETGDVIIPVDFPVPAATTLELRFLNGGRLVDASAIQIGRSAPPVTSHAAAPLRVDSQELLSGANTRIRGAGFETGISQRRGLLQYVTAGGTPVLYDQPQIHVLPIPTHSSSLPDAMTWTLDRPVEVASRDGATIITSQGHYRNFVGTYDTTIHPDGGITVSYDFAYTGPAIRVREVGFQLPLASSFDRLSWTRNGEWTWYPADHIGALSGSASAHSNRPPFVQPDWPYADDDSPLGTNAFRSTKRNIVEASITDSQGRGLAIHSGGNQHLRAAVDSDRNRLYVNDWFGGTSVRAGEWTSNYGEGKLLETGERIRATLRLSLLPGVPAQSHYDKRTEDANH